ncbi:MAG TPA: STAS/SEC14 domain-containing protein [Flavobacteriales bacterium]|nr:STAS/SEC14 domain-containing protein [Flavobacteriales bacterium]HQV74939.1 STAS/SEC14 domain-containing protein [Flavobacteriales bacterium]HQW41318.1 STAS/SEC14 domain-containing protein [Flavobacteriales bacterium]
MSSASPKIIRDDDKVRMEVDLRRSLISIVWQGYVPSPDYRAILLQALDLIIVHGLKSWVSDSTRMGVILRSDEKWTLDVCTPMLVKGGLRRVAIVRSMDFFSQTASERMVEATTGKVPYVVEFFNDKEAALAWLAKELKALV